MGLYDDPYLEYVTKELHRLILLDLDTLYFGGDGHDLMYWPDDEEEAKWDH